MRTVLLAAVLSLAPLCSATADGGVGQILRGENGLVTVGYQASPDLVPGAVIQLKKVFHNERVSVAASVVSVDRAAGTATLRLDGPARRGVFAVLDYVQFRVRRPGGIITSPAASAPAAPRPVPGAGQDPNVPSTARP